MRFKLFKMVIGGIISFYYFMGESKKRHYAMTFNEKLEVTGFRKFNKGKNEGYFLLKEGEK